MSGRPIQVPASAGADIRCRGFNLTRDLMVLLSLPLCRQAAWRGDGPSAQRVRCGHPSPVGEEPDSYLRSLPSPARVLPLRANGYRRFSSKIHEVVSVRKTEPARAMVL